MLAMLLTILTSGVFAQGTVKGIVVDASTNEHLIGTTVIVKGTTTGVVTNAMGLFSMRVPTGKQTILVQFVGFTTKEIDVNVKDAEVIDLGTIKIEPDQIGIAEVSVFASVAVTRRTPVAQSKITPIQIEERLGTQEFPEILKSTPGVYATKQGGGFGDSRINLRGFESANIAVMINGVPERYGVGWSLLVQLGWPVRCYPYHAGTKRIGCLKGGCSVVGWIYQYYHKFYRCKKGRYSVLRFR